MELVADAPVRLALHVDTRFPTRQRLYCFARRVDRRMYQEDIAGSIAHAEMLAKQGIISQSDAASQSSPV